MKIHIVDKKIIEKLYKNIPTYKKYSYYTIPEFDKKIELYLQKKSISGTQYSNIINEIQKVSTKIFLIGGIVRDLLIGREVNDIDMSIESSTKKVSTMCHINNWNCYINHNGKYIALNKEIDIFYDLYRVFEYTKEQYDFTINHIIYDFDNKIIIDKTSHGLQDVFNKIIRIPVEKEKYNKWALFKSDHILRFFKFIQYGFTPCDKETTNFIVSYMQQNFEQIYMRKTASDISYIKKYIITNISGGNVYTKGKFVYGLQLYKVVPYLKVLQKYLDPEYFIRIYNSFNKHKEFGYQVNSKIGFPAYKIEDFDNTFKKYILPAKIEDIGYSYKTIFNHILTITDTIYLYGGSVRDLLLYKKPTNINIMFLSDKKSVEELCKKHNWPCSKLIDKDNYIVFGKYRGITLEGYYDLYIFNQKVIEYNFSTNKLVYDIKKKVIYDITNIGLGDTLDKKIMIPSLYYNYTEWAKEDYKKCLVYFKLKMNKFTPALPIIEKFVISYLEKNFYTIYMKKNKYNIRPIILFIVGSLTHGVIYEDGSYTLGILKKRFIPYLRVLYTHLQKKYTNILFKELRLDKNIISSIVNIKKN